MNLFLLFTKEKMKDFSYSEVRLIISNSTRNNINLPYLELIDENSKIFSVRIYLIKTLKTYIKKYCLNDPNKYNILYLSILYIDIILSKNKICLSYDINLKYLCLCCFLLSLKFMGNYDISKKIIKNFCYNYRQQYKIFEMQCLILLENNLIYTTVYDYINMILIKDQKKLLNVCSSLLYHLCEDNLYIIYSPFYISIAIIQLAKNSINDTTHNHYDKYFADQRVKYLYKKFNNIINLHVHYRPLTINNLIDEKQFNYSEITNNFSNKNCNKKKFENFNNNSNYSHYKNNFSSNINIISNNNIQNNIVIINEFLGKKNNKKNVYNNNNNNKNERKTFIINKNKTPIKLFINRHNNTRISVDIVENQKNDNYYNDDEEYKINNYFEKPNKIISKKPTLSKSYLDKNSLIFDNYGHNTHKAAKINQNKSIRIFNNINYNPKSSKNLPNYCSDRNYDYNSYKIKKNNRINSENDNKEQDINISNDIVENQIKSSKSVNKKVIYLNKSTLNFKLLLGVSKEKLVKLSRNLSKNFIKPNDKLELDQK